MTVLKSGFFEMFKILSSISTIDWDLTNAENETVEDVARSKDYCQLINWIHFPYFNLRSGKLRQMQAGGPRKPFLDYIPNTIEYRTRFLEEERTKAVTLPECPVSPHII